MRSNTQQNKSEQRVAGQMMAAEVRRANEAGIVQGMQMALRICKHFYGSEVPVELFDKCCEATGSCKTWGDVDEALAKVMGAVEKGEEESPVDE